MFGGLLVTPGSSAISQRIVQSFVSADERLGAVNSHRWNLVALASTWSAASSSNTASVVPCREISPCWPVPVICGSYQPVPSSSPAATSCTNQCTWVSVTVGPACETTKCELSCQAG